MVGAVVGSQPFGGVGLSGSGYKAGGPNYLLQFLNEKVISKIQLPLAEIQNCLIFKKTNDWLQKNSILKLVIGIFLISIFAIVLLYVDSTPRKAKTN